MTKHELDEIRNKFLRSVEHKFKQTYNEDHELLIRRPYKKSIYQYIMRVFEQYGMFVFWNWVYVSLVI